MQTFKFLTKEKGQYVCWCVTNQPKTFRDFMQYVIDNCIDPKSFLLYDCDNEKIYNMMDIAIKQFGMRKRTFMERLNDVQTGTWKVEV